MTSNNEETSTSNVAQYNNYKRPVYCPSDVESSETPDSDLDQDCIQYNLPLRGMEEGPRITLNLSMRRRLVRAEKMKRILGSSD